MHPLLKQLLSLQELDYEVLSLERCLKEMPIQIESSKAHLGIEKNAVDAVRQEMEELKKKRIQLESEAAIQADQMAKTKIKQTSVKTNEEFTALKAEIEFIKQKIASIEDEELIVMEKMDEKEKTFPQVEAKFKKEEERFLKFKKQKETTIKDFRQNLVVMKMRREELEKTIEPEWANHYQKVVKMRGENVVVAIVGDQCQGCHQQLKPQLVIDVKIGEKVFECDRCNRIVYWQSEEEAEVVVPE